MKQISKIFFYLIAISFILSSCSMAKKIPYFKDLESSNEESEVYPQIGYKFKTNSEFTW